MIVLFEEIKGEQALVEQDLEKEWLSKVLSGEGPDTRFRPVSKAGSEGGVREGVGRQPLAPREGSVKVMGPARDAWPRPRSTCRWTSNSVSSSSSRGRQTGGGGGGAEDEEGRRSFDLHAVEEEVFDGKKIDLDAILREQILLALPIAERRRRREETVQTGPAMPNRAAIPMQGAVHAVDQRRGRGPLPREVPLVPARDVVGGGQARAEVEADALRVLCARRGERLGGHALGQRQRAEAALRRGRGRPDQGNP